MMHRAAKWKAEKNKVKVVFRLQLHATQVPQPGWDKLFVSLIPVETGKATAKTTKASVRNGSCKWSDPIYETTRLLQDAKTKKFDEKLFKLVVSMVSSRHGILGEASINLADFAEVVKPASVSLPLQSCSFGTTLHVTVQPLTSKTGFREFEQQRDITERGFRIPQAVDDEPHRDALATEENVDGHDVKLEKMKNENLAPFQQENELMSELDAQDPLRKEVQQLQMANEQLESMFPSFIEPSKGGNAIERVLALETELADALKANSTQKRQFQSSFVKQQADQAAMLQSFRDINELINDMLELKRKNSVLDDELKEMQRRYSQISLQFAEVEGERQQLVMTIKSMRAGKKS